MGVTEGLGVYPVQAATPAAKRQLDIAGSLGNVLQGLGYVSSAVANQRRQTEFADQKEKSRNIATQKNALALDVAQVDLENFPTTEGNTPLQDVDAWFAEKAEGFEPEAIAPYRARLVGKLAELGRLKAREVIWDGLNSEGLGLQHRLTTEEINSELLGEFADYEAEAMDFGEKPAAFLRRVLKPAAEAVADSAVTDEDVARADGLAQLIEDRGRPDFAENIRSQARLQRGKAHYQSLSERLNNTESQADVQVIADEVDRLADEAGGNILAEGQRERLSAKIATRSGEFRNAARLAVENDVYRYAMGMTDQKITRAQIVKKVHEAVGKTHTAKEAKTLLAGIGETLKQREARSRVVAKATGKAAGPLGKKDDAAAGELLDELYAPDDRIQRSRFIAATEWVPTRTAEKIARGMISNDADIATRAMLDYAHLSAAYPRGGDFIFDKLDDAAQARVMALRLKAEQSGIDLSNGEKLHEFVTASAAEIMAVKPVDMNFQDALNDILRPHAKADEQGNIPKIAAQQYLGRRVMQQAVQGWDKDNYDSIEDMSTEASNRVIRHATDTYRAMLASGWPSKLAAERSLKMAEQRAAGEMRIVNHNGRLIDLGGGPKVDQHSGDRLLNHVQSALEQDGWAAANDHAKTYRPVWSAGHGGYVYVGTGEWNQGEVLGLWEGSGRRTFVSYGAADGPIPTDSGSIKMALDEFTRDKPEAPQIPERPAPLPTDPKRLVAGRLYDYNGQVVKWNGSEAEVIE